VPERIVRIATFNLESLDDRPGAAPDFATRLPVLRARLLRLRADVLCLQEIAARHQNGKSLPRRLTALDALIADTPYAGYERVVSLARDGHGPLDVHNLAILSRPKLLAQCQYWHDLVEPVRYRLATALPASDAVQIRWERPVLHATVSAPDGPPVHVFNVHLRAPLAAHIPGQKTSAFVWRTASGWAEGFFLAAVKRAGQALETRRAIDALFDREPEARIVVCGDMNAEEREMPLRILRADEADTGSALLANRTLVPLERGLPETRRFTVLHGGRPCMLDHVLASPTLFARYRSVEIHNEALEDEAEAERRVAPLADSYHAPVVATFDL
jgi:endonuclease/exonuclease/phosphatase family metal-dependent hydrolase